MCQKKKIRYSYGRAKVLVMRSIFGALHEIISEGAFRKYVSLLIIIFSIRDIFRSLLRDLLLRQIKI